MAEPLYFVHIADTHIGPEPGYSRHGQLALPPAQRLVDIINNLPQRPDFVVHSGDVVADPEPEAYQLAAETLGKLEVPVYYVNGNHDAAPDILKYLEMGPREPLVEDEGTLCYALERKGWRFLVLDAKGPPEIDPRGDLSREQMEILRREAQPSGPPLVVFIHFPALRLNSPWMDEYMLIRNGREFHESLIPARERLRGVFHGHVHQSMQTFRDGIAYVAVGSVFAQFTAWPDEEEVGHAPDAPPAFNFVHLLPDQTIVHQHTFPRP